MSKKSYKDYVVGYEDNADGYRIYVPELNDVLRSRDVRFNPEKCVMEISPRVPDDVPSQGEQPPEDESLASSEDSRGEENESTKVPNSNDGENIDEIPAQPIVRSGPALRDRTKLRTSSCSICPRPNRVLLVCDDLPKTAKEARTSSSSGEW